MGLIPTEKSAIKTERLTRLSLDEMNAFASLQTRTDRKYIIQNTTCNRLIKEVDIQGGVLDLNGKRSTMYQTIYFDTPDLDIYIKTLLTEEDQGLKHGHVSTRIQIQPCLKSRQKMDAAKP